MIHLYSFYYNIYGTAEKVYSPALCTITEFNDHMQVSSLNYSPPKSILHCLWEKETKAKTEALETRPQVMISRFCMWDQL